MSHLSFLKLWWLYFINNKLGFATAIFTLAFYFVGMPAEIIDLWMAKNTAGVSLVMLILLFVQSFFWVFYALQIKDWFLGVTNVVGTLLALVLLVEYLYILWS